MPIEERGARILLAHMLLADKLGNAVSLAEFGRRVAKEEGREEPYSPGTVSRWESGDGQPSVDTLAAIARLCDVEFGWLAIGEEGGEPPEQQVDLRLLAAARRGGRRATGTG
jgi:transcriptional regulator with XRE-family HTH domain